MALSWNEIKERATKFSKEWENAFNEDAEAKTFLYEFFNIFGISQRRVATFEHRVKKLDQHDGYIDLLWKGTILIEMKSRGKSLDKAYHQSKDYLDGLKQHELPKYILVCDFENFRLYDIDDNKEIDFQLKDFVSNVHLFGFIAGYQKKVYKEEDPVNIEAAYLMGKLHDALKEAGYTGHELEKYLVRLLFCLFAEDTTIFDKNAFQDYVEIKTNEDGSDIGIHIAQLFQVLNTPPEKRQKTLDESLSAFRYVNGTLFEEQLSFASFNSKMRQTLLECCYLDWSKISPAIFGSLFQSIMNPIERRNIGAHYTSEKNILKLIKPLFLDNLWEEFEAVKDNKNKLIKFHDKISTFRFLDPACGCGNFLVITYRELRLLEIEIIKVLQKGQYVTDVCTLIKVDVDRFYGIEYEEFPAQIAQVAMWLVDHQMNMRISEIFGEYFVRLPLRKSPVIVNTNSLRIDWHKLIDPIPWEKKTQRFDYILGNPPFVGKQMQNEQQKEDMDLIWKGVNGAGVLDYVTCWHIKAAKYLTDYSPQTDESNEIRTKVAFVSTNSIAQGEQVGILWNELFNKYKIKIHFAHRTFKWSNEAKGKAAVHVVIIGFSNFDISNKHIYEYEDIKSEPHELKVKNINPYLVEATDFVILKRKTPVCNVPEMSYGSMANDGGLLLLNNEEKESIILNDNSSQQFIKQFVGSFEFINGVKRWCIWLKDVDPDKYSNFKEIYKRIQQVKEYRLKSKRDSTKKLANYPMLFGEIRQPIKDYLLIPGVSSEFRKYIPIGFLSKDIIASDLVRTVPESSMYNFGVLTSIMHMTWVNYVCGRLKSDFRYSGSLVYNNYPWPENPTEKQKKIIEDSAENILLVRKQFPDSSLADLYDSLTMPPALVKAHQELDKAVDLAYRPQPFINEAKRIEFLFELYEKYTADLFTKGKR